MNKEFNLEEAEEFIDNIYQHKFDNMEEILEDGTQVVHLGGLDDIKFTDFESASFTLLRGEQRLKHQVKKQKEAIDKAIEFSNKNWGTWCSNHFVYMTELQNILKEVSEEPLEKDISFIIRPTNELTYDELQQENKQLKEKLSKIETLTINHNCDTGDIYYKYNNKFLKSELKQRILEIVYEVSK